MEKNRRIIVKQEPSSNMCAVNEENNQSDTLTKEEICGCDVKKEKPNLEENIRLTIKQEPSLDGHVVNEGDDNQSDTPTKEEFCGCDVKQEEVYEECETEYQGGELSAMKDEPDEIKQESTSP